MIDSRIWDKAWSDARANGIDGFTVGFKPGTHPGPIHWEMYCDVCKCLMKHNVMPREHDRPDFCPKCELLLKRAEEQKQFNTVWYYEI